MIKYFLQFFFSFIFSIYFIPLFGQNDSVTKDSIQPIIERKNLENINITSNRFITLNNKTPKNIHIISNETINENPTKSISDLLNQISGIQIVGAHSNFSAIKTLNLRGMNNHNTLILIDGIPINDPTGIGSGFEIRLLSPQSFSQVEILKGAQSALYGSDAVSGVVNFITNVEEKGKIQVEGDLAFGNFSSRQANLKAFLPIHKKMNFQASYSRFQTEGVSEAKDTTTAQNFDHDETIQNNFDFRLNYYPHQNFKIVPFFKLFTYYGDYDDGAFSDNVTNSFDVSFINLGYLFSFTKDKLDIQNHFSSQRIRRSFNDMSIYTPESNLGYSNFGNISGKYNFNTNFSAIGNIDFRNHQYSNLQALTYDSNFSVIGSTESSYSLNQISPSINGIFHWNEKIFFETGIRLNFSNMFRPQFSYNAHLSYSPMSLFQIFTGASNAFKTPSLFQLYSRYGNRELAPEQNMTYELGIKGQSLIKNIQYKLASFITNSRNIISYIGGQYVNFDKQNNYGVESDFQINILKNLSFSIGYSFIDGRITTKNSNTSNDTTYNNLYKIGSNKLVISSKYSFWEDASVSLSSMFVSRRNDLTFDDFFNPLQVSLRSYFLLNFSTFVKFYQLHETKFFVFADIKNMTNQNFTETYGFSTLGFNFMIGIKVKFN